ncbi:MAG: hypothetical protein RIS94_940 [Pseudomonadota bacterium]|jgi:two-component system nitrate/nitrite response regulator NarL
MELDAKTSVFLQCRNSINREGMRLLLDSEGLNVLVSEESLGDVRKWPDDIDSPLLILLDVEDGEASYGNLGDIRARYPQAFVVILAETFDFNQVTRAFDAGVHGYILKEIPCRSLVESLRLVAMGEKVLPGALVGFLPGRPSVAADACDGPGNPARALSERELETFHRMSRGEPNKVIAHNLGITEATVKVHVKAILRKLHLRNRTQAVAWALNSGFDFTMREAATGVVTVPSRGRQAA